MSDQLVGPLATLLHAVEFAGKYPKEIEEIFVKLIPKKDGTTRPIVLFRSLTRLMGKARKPGVAKWGQDFASGAIFNNSGGRRIADGIWRLAWRNYLELGEHKHAAEIMWDLKKAFETLDRDTLWEMGERYSYPMDALRLSLGTYAMTGRLQL